MGVLRKERKFYMYDYVEDKVLLKEAQTFCSTLMRELENELSKYGLHCAASFGRKYMTYVKQIREKDR